jgi:hypothetical protein
MDVAILLFIIIGIYLIQRNAWQKKIDKPKQFFIDVLFAMHFVLFLVYILYTLNNRSDSGEYYRKAVEAESWISTWGTQTQFIVFVTWPFANFFGLSYIAVMMLFAYLGFQGIAFLYLTAKENIPTLKSVFFGLSILEIIFLLPNLHFWSASIGKGSGMIFATGLFIYGVSRFNQRKIIIAAAGFLMYLIRPHVLYGCILGIAIAILFSKKGLAVSSKIIIGIAAAAVLYFISGDVTRLSGGSGFDIFNSNFLDHRNAEFSRAGSGIEVSNNEFVKLFTFWFRPLFIDAPGVLGIIVSFENLVMLIFFVQLLKNFFKKWKMMNTFYRILIFSFLFASVALAQLGGNLGIIMRQKSQIMPLFFIVFCYCEALKQRKLV